MDSTPRYLVLNQEKPVTPRELLRAVKDRRLEQVLLIDRSEFQKGAFSLDWIGQQCPLYILFGRDREEVNALTIRLRECGYHGPIKHCIAVGRADQPAAKTPKQRKEQ
jgi:hypothetical protein